MRLLDYAAVVYSQNGEDGIFSKILELLPIKDKWCVEFGAFDGQHFSNTCNLIQNCGYSSVMIEANRKDFDDLLKRYSSNRNVIAVNRFVGFKPDDNLDHILSDTPIPKDFDVLSIDIDGNDYHVWNAISSYASKIVCIEYNPTIPTEVEFVQPADPSVNQGSSLLALTRLGQRKGYDLVCATHNNAIFVRSEYFPLLGISDNDPHTLREDVSNVTYLFAGLDGTIFVTGRGVLSHRGIRISKRVRQLPKIFRKYPPNFGPITRVLYKFYWRAARVVGRA